MTATSSRQIETALRTVCAVVMAAALPLMGLLVLRLPIGLGMPSAVWIVAGLACGVLAADFVSGFVHWACDTWGSPHTRWIGPALIHSFREHHIDETAMLDHDWVEVNREPGLAAALVLLLLVTPPGAALLAGHAFVHGFACSFLAFAGVANQLHAWAHSPKPPSCVRRLQAWGLILSPGAHDRHHVAPHTSAYCISSGWLNAPLDRLDFWRGLERLTSRWTGFQARAMHSPEWGARGRPRR